MTDQTTTVADLALSQSAFLVSQAIVELDAMFGGNVILVIKELM